MRLKQIKLAGFKSFVDVTKVPFPQQMTAIVGPNGCGKSNIIDAVRWVLGESSAKNLRGDAMTDVIFNGSTARKPVGQASVELLFDNQNHNRSQAPNEQTEPQFHLAENLSDRAEISVRRTVNRDGINHYYLNGSKCRKKDITDVFLGSGLGPKSYAIIEQGMISRLIESKPQDLRVFVEEAAGVSKYKERRRETENKLKATRENMQRLADISQEINLHLDVLRHQANAAKEFRSLKAQERELKTEIALIKQQKAQQLLVENEDKMIDIEQQFHSKENELVESRQHIAKLEQTVEDLLSQNQRHQEQFSTAKQQTLLIEHQLEHSKQQSEKVSTRKQALETKLATIIAQVQSLQTEKEKVLQTLAESKPQVERYKNNLANEEEQLTQLLEEQTGKEQKLKALQTNQLTYKQEELANTQATFEISQKLARLNAFHEEKTHQLNALMSSQKNDLSSQYQQIETLEKQEAGLIVQIDEAERELDDLRRQQSQFTKDKQALEAKTVNFQGQIQLIDRQLTQKPEWQHELLACLAQHNIEQLGAFHQFIHVEAKWQLAANKVLGQWLQAIVVNNVESLPELAEIDNYWLVDASKLIDESDAKPNTLASVIRSDLGLLPFLNHVYIVDSTESAYQRLLTLNEGESVVSSDGCFFMAAANTKGEQGTQIDILSLQHQKLTLQSELSLKQTQLHKQITELSAVEAKVKECEQTLAAKQQKYQQAKFQLTQQKQQIEQVIVQDKNQQAQQQALAHSLEELAGKISALNEQQLSLKVNFNPASESQLIEQQIALSITKLEKIKHQVDIKQNALETIKQAHHQAQLQDNQQSMLLSQIQLQLSNALEQQSIVDEQIQQWQSELTLLPDIEVLKEKLEQAKANELAKADAVNDIEQQLIQHKGEISKLKLSLESDTSLVEQLKNAYHQLALKNEQLTFELAAITKQLDELAGTNNLLMNLADQNRSLNFCQKALSQVTKRLNELGVVNLAAIDECQVQEQRKNQIDLQIEDLTQALATLESAIAKIDKESRAKFKSTFEQINHDFTQLFPKVFGGGSAYLALTSEDMLETGVTIMARPPGKKNSTIHLLSGGEKALTALSLVFAIFKLTPAPFCMLDEVDAPLDDANVERFCNLVQEMSKTVQFIYISHNKIAMEMASHLTGVTMGEPGVSRMVSVDIDEAIAMAEVS